jgi:hypothetical protein
MSHFSIKTNISHVRRPQKSMDGSPTGLPSASTCNLAYMHLEAVYHVLENVIDISRQEARVVTILKLATVLSDRLKER